MIRSFFQCFRPPYLLITLAFLLTVFEGSFRKWVPGLSSGLARDLIYFSKDILILMTIPMALHRGQSSSERLDRLITLFKFATALMVAGGALSASHGLNPVGALLSIRAVFILPLAALIYVRSVQTFPVVGFLLIVVILTGVNFFLSLVQTTLPPSHILNKYAMGGDYGVAEVSQGVRATGTFAYISGLSIMSTIGVWAGLTLLAISRDIYGKLIGIVGFLFGVGCAFNSFSRSPFVLATAIFSAFLLAALKRRRSLLAPLALAAALLLALPAAFPNFASKIENSITGTFDRLENAGDSSVHRAFGQWSELAEAFQLNPLGSGLGSEQVAGSFVSTGTLSFNRYENQLPRIQNEFGMVGLVGFFILCYSWIVGLRNSGLMKSNPVILGLFVTQVFILTQFYTNIVYNHIASSAVWIICTVLVSGYSNNDEDLDEELTTTDSFEIAFTSTPDSSSTPGR